MKKSFLSILFVIAVIVSVLAAGKERPVTVQELPKMAREFLNTHFKDKTVAYAVADQKYAGAEYEVVYTDRTEVDFRTDGQWESVKSRYSPVPEAIVPQQIRDFVAKGNFPGQYICKIKRNAYTWEIELSTGAEIKFDMQFRVIDYDRNGGDQAMNKEPGERLITETELPKAAQEFLSSHFKGKKPAYIVAEHKRVGTEYEVVYADRTEVDFRTDGQWESVESKYSPVPESVLPAQIRDFVKNGNFSGQFIRGIERGIYTWEIELSTGLEVKFDMQFEVIGYDD